MGKTLVSPSLLTQFGISQWNIREPILLKGWSGQQLENTTLSGSILANPPAIEEDKAIVSPQQPVSVTEPTASSSGSCNESAIIVLGSGLDAVWENEGHPAWQLWQHIAFAFNWVELPVEFYDLDHLVTEEMVFSVIEEIITCGVDWVLTMDGEHPVSEQLADGVQVIEIPDFDLMLSDPYSKKDFYESVSCLK